MTECIHAEKLTNRGYPAVRYSKVQHKTMAAIRVIYEEAHGLIPEGLVIDHLCGAPSCINPDHLEAVTARENYDRAMASRTHCKNGHEWTEENTQRSATRRKCRACNRAHTRAKRLRDR